MQSDVLASAFDREWLARRLVESVDELARFLAAIPTERLTLAPPARGGYTPLGAWSAHRHLFHLVHYERRLALPALRCAVEGDNHGKKVQDTREPPDEDAAYDATTQVEVLIDELRDLRGKQAALLRRADLSSLQKPAVLWGASVLWTVVKTVQHTAEHVDDVARLGLFWDTFVERRAEPPEQTLVGVGRAWLTSLQDCVRAVDFERARPLFADDVVSFGTFARIVHGRDSLERDQWRHVWPTIRDFSFRLDEVHCVGGDQTLVVVAPWDSHGVRPDGSTFARPGRATIVLTRRDRRWVALHSHFSLVPVP